MSMNFREFVDNIKGAVTEQVRLITGAQDVLPFVHFVRDENVHGIAVAGDWFTPDHREQLMDQLVLPYVEVLKPSYVGWTFTGQRGSADGEWDHETAVAVCIERERTEVWLARLVRHDDIASLGAWRPWPADQQDGLLLAGVQAALR